MHKVRQLTLALGSAPDCFQPADPGVRAAYVDALGTLAQCRLSDRADYRQMQACESYSAAEYGIASHDARAFIAGG